MILILVWISFVVSMEFTCSADQRDREIGPLGLDYRKYDIPSPNDLVTHGRNINPLGKRIKVLWLTNWNNYNYNMDRHFFLQYDQIKNENPYIEASLWGFDFPDYLSNMTLKENLDRKFGHPFDMVYVYGFVNNEQIRSLSENVVIAKRWHECWKGRCMPTIKEMNATVVLLTYASEMEQFRKESYDKVVMLSPQSSHSGIFSASPEKPRDIPILLVGNTDGQVYPLRNRLARMIKSGKLPGRVRDFPGYVEIDERLKKVNDVTTMEKQVLDYASELSRAKICIVTSSKLRYLLTKYAEAALSGCMLVGDAPHELPWMLERTMLRIDLSDSDEDIAAKIGYFLSNEKDRLYYAKLTHAMAQNYLTWDNFGYLLFDAYTKYINKQYGMYYTYPYRVTCSATDAHSQQFNEWCSRGSV